MHEAISLGQLYVIIYNNNNGPFVCFNVSITQSDRPKILIIATCIALERLINFPTCSRRVIQIQYDNVV